MEAKAGRGKSPRRQWPPILSARADRGLPGQADSFPAVSLASGGRKHAQRLRQPTRPAPPPPSRALSPGGCPGNLHARLRFPGDRDRLPGSGPAPRNGPAAAQAQWGVPASVPTPSRLARASLCSSVSLACTATEPAAQGHLSGRRGPSRGGVRPLEGGDGLGARWAWRGLQEAEAEEKGGSSGHRRPPAALTGWAGPGSGRARAASALRPRPRVRRRPSGRGLQAAARSAAAGCECGPSPRGRAPEGPAWRLLDPAPNPGAP